MYSLLISISHFSSIIFLFLLLPDTQAKTNSGGNNNTNITTNEFCRPTTCGGNGPEIRFPFRLKTQPVFCGLDGFELSCSNNNTLLHLPSSSSNNGDFYVQEISYLHSTITIIDANEQTTCPVKILLSLNLTSSKFAFSEIWYINWNIAIVNCTAKIAQSSNEIEEVGPIDCISDDKFFVYVISGIESMDRLPSNCSVSQTTYIPTGSDINSTVRNFLEKRRMVMAWEALDGCYGCEKSGKFCGFNFTTNSTICLKKKEPLPISVIIAISIGCATFFSLVMLLIYKSIKSDKEKEVQQRVEKFLEDYKTHNPTRYTYSDLKKITGKFKHKLGQGGYGSVYKGELPNGIPVAVKILEHSNANGEDFINEVAIIGRIHHFNIVRLLGFCSEGTRHAIIYEFMLNGSLEKFIFSKMNESNHRLLSWEKLLKIAFGVARGIEYLHQGCKQRILHFDIKPHNILLDHNFHPKISDFGLAKLCSKEISIVSMTAARGTVGYIAPELFSRNFGEVSYKSDVFSYGMMLLEMVGCRKNIDFTIENQSQVYFPEWVYNRVSQGREISIKIEEDGDEEIAKKLAIVGLWCIQWNPTDRPSMTMVMQMLEGQLQSLEMPPKPFVSSDVEMNEIS
ncbi:hypothetical protein Ddye_030083 [Dipteronia dyeriana]|uniref:Protein kinase domain-containing protein n=1 Tax=Dipteronia dyeriana TaxID=168575 RepID=A0AAD9TG05_9ROSI|nr:hypothetical protein Ddye_030083 [Dipteronia dyeriana]